MARNAPGSLECDDRLIRVGPGPGPGPGPSSLGIPGPIRFRRKLQHNPRRPFSLDHLFDMGASTLKDCLIVLLTGANRQVSLGSKCQEVALISNTQRPRVLDMLQAYR